ncbi:hypothetical protein Tco_0778398, partial [Tanacetum coccineum]
MVKKSKDLPIISYYQLFAYLKQNQDDTNEIQAESAARTHDPLVLVSKTYNASTLYTYPTPQYNQQMSYAPQQSYVAHIVHQLSLEIPTSPDSRLAIPTFNTIDDPIKCLNKAVLFLRKALTTRYLPTNN